MSQLIKRFTFLLLAIVCVIIPLRTLTANALSATDWQAGKIIDDGIFYSGGDMSSAAIQSFLNSKLLTCDTNGSLPRGNTTRAAYGTSVGYPPPYTCLKDFRQDTPNVAADSNLCGAYTGGNKSAAEIIVDVSKSCGISARALVVLLEKEQGLVTDDWPWSNQYRSATGYGCPDTASCDTKYYGFFNQVYNAAWQFKYYAANPASFRYVPNQNNTIQYNPNVSCGSSTVYIANKATAGLYNYTPYQPNSAALSNLYGSGDSCSAYGNRNFWRLFNDWFGNPLYPPSPIYLPDGTYSIKGLGSGKNIDVAGGSVTDGARVQLYTGNGTDAQKWKLTRDNNGYYSLQNIASSKYLDVKDAARVPGSSVQIWSGNGSCAQTWALQQGAGSNYVLLNACSGLALDVSGGSTSDSTPLMLSTRSSFSNQSWGFTALDNPLASNGFYNLQTPAGTVLDIPGGSTADGTALQIFASNGSGAQTWQIARLTSGLYEIRNPQSGKDLDVKGGGTSAGTRVQIYTGNNTCSQQWALSKNTDGSYGFRSSCSGKSLDIVGGATGTNGTSVDVYDSNGSDAQKLTLAPVSTIVSNGFYNLQTPAGTVLDIPGGSTAAGTALQIFANNGSGAQTWQVTQLANGLFTISNPQSGKYLDVRGGSSLSGTRVQIYTGNNTCSQQWAITKTATGSYGIISSCSNKNLDVSGGAIGTNGAITDIYDANGSDAQKWALTPN